MVARSVFLGGLLLILSATAGAGSFSSTHGLGVLFQLRGLSDLQLASYQGGIGLRWELGRNCVLRPCLSFSANALEDEDPARRVSRTNKTRGAGISCMLEKRLVANRRLVPYVGGGPEFSASRSTQKTRTEHSSQAINTDWWDFQLFAMAGFEWWATSNISLGGEYFVLYKREHGEAILTAWDGDTKTIEKYTRWRLLTGTASVFMTVYFN